MGTQKDTRDEGTLSHGLGKARTSTAAAANGRQSQTHASATRATRAWYASCLGHEIVNVPILVAADLGFEHLTPALVESGHFLTRERVDDSGSTEKRMWIQYCTGSHKQSSGCRRPHQLPTNQRTASICRISDSSWASSCTILMLELMSCTFSEFGPYATDETTRTIAGLSSAINVPEPRRLVMISRLMSLRRIFSASILLAWWMACNLAERVTVVMAAFDKRTRGVYVRKNAITV